MMMMMKILAAYLTSPAENRVCPLLQFLSQWQRLLTVHPSIADLHGLEGGSYSPLSPSRTPIHYMWENASKQGRIYGVMCLVPRYEGDIRLRIDNEILSLQMDPFCAAEIRHCVEGWALTTDQ